jgi:uncharacterized damage-inducible protein DinB
MKFFNYHLWANQKVYNHLKELPQEVIYQEVQSVFPSLYDTLFHIYRIDFVWFGVVKEDSFEKIIAGVGELMKENPERSFEKLEESHRQLLEQYRRFVTGLGDVNTKITVHHPSYGSLTASYSDLLQHVANHGTYHRGNITAMLRQLGYEGIPSDYIFYLFDDKETV